MADYVGVVDEYFQRPVPVPGCVFLDFVLQIGTFLKVGTFHDRPSLTIDIGDVINGDALRALHHPRQGGDDLFERVHLVVVQNGAVVVDVEETFGVVPEAHVRYVFGGEQIVDVPSDHLEHEPAALNHIRTNVQLRLPFGRFGVVAAIWIAFPRFRIATVAASAAARRAHAVLVEAVNRVLETVHAQHTGLVDAAFPAQIGRLAHFEHAPAYGGGTFLRMQLGHHLVRVLAVADEALQRAD